NVAENSTVYTMVTSLDFDAVPSLSYSITGGADGAKFTIDASTGALSFVSAPNFETPTDAGGNNVYDVTVQVSDGTFTDTQDIAEIGSASCRKSVEISIAACQVKTKK